MKRRITPSACIVLMLISAFVAFQITYSYITNKYEGTIYGFSKWTEINNKLDLIEELAGDGTGTSWQNVYSLLSEVDAHARMSYVGEINENNLLDYTLTGYIFGLGDKHSVYMPKSEYEAFKQSTIEGSMVGIGVRIAYDNELSGIYITSVMPNSPAQNAGIKPGDVIVAVEGKYVSDIGYYNAYNLIKEGDEGEAVNLTVAEYSTGYATTMELSPIRSAIDTQTVMSRIIGYEIAYIEIAEFNSTTSEEFISVMEALKAQGVKKYIFDVRNNPGGVLTSVAKTLDFLLPEGPIIRCVAKNGREEIISSDAKSFEDDFDAQMVVLVNEHTASAAELFTAALRDYKKATVIGTKTYGKGSVQSIIPLSNGGAAKLSTQMYKPPYSDNYDGIGLVPDKTIELSDEAKLNFYKLTDEQDLQLASAVDELNAR